MVFPKFSNPFVVGHFTHSNIQTDWNGKKITAMCAVIKANQTPKETKEEKVKSIDSADQYGEISIIIELKEKGIITEEEFNMKKKQLLGL